MFNLRGVLLFVGIMLLVGAASAGTTYTFYTTNESDGYLRQSAHNSSWATTMTGGTVTASLADANNVGAYLSADLTEDTYYRLYRIATIFDTSSLPDGAIPTAATLGLRRYSNAVLLGDTGIGVTKFDNATITGGDWAKFGETRYADDKLISTISSSGYKNWTLNSIALENISKTSTTGYGVRLAWDIDNTAPTYAASQASLFYINFADSVTYPPFLEVTIMDAPTSSFTADYTGGISPLLVNFTDTTTGDAPTAWAWYDNDTLFNSTQTPQFVPFTTGNHPIRLNASNAAGGTNSSITWINVTDAPEPVLPVPDFSADDTTVTWPTAVQFTDLSESNILGRNWTFGDGTDSTAANPLHTYPNTDATYTVILEVVNISGYNTTTKADYITVTSLDPPVASFTKNATIGVQPATIQFNDTSTNTPTMWNWSFGDGNWSNGTTQNVTHTYDFAGTFNSFLIATNAAGSNQSANQTVTIYDPVTADFTATASGTTVTFTDLSTGTPTSWVWQYNRHESPAWVEFSTNQNSSYDFNTGTYDINFTATNPAGSVDSEAKTSFVIVSPAGEGKVFPTEPSTLEATKARYAAGWDTDYATMHVLWLLPLIIGVALALAAFTGKQTDYTLLMAGVISITIGMIILVVIFGLMSTVGGVMD